MAPAARIISNHNGWRVLSNPPVSSSQNKETQASSKPTRDVQEAILNLNASRVPTTTSTQNAAAFTANKMIEITSAVEKFRSQIQRLMTRLPCGESVRVVRENAFRASVKAHARRRNAVTPIV